jgi:hypothetical protein
LIFFQLSWALTPVLESKSTPILKVSIYHRQVL